MCISYEIHTLCYVYVILLYVVVAMCMSLLLLLLFDGVVLGSGYKVYIIGPMLVNRYTVICLVLLRCVYHVINIAILLCCAG